MFQQLVNLIWFCDASFSVPSSKRLRMCFSSCVLVQSSQKKLRGIEISFKSKSSHNLRHQIMEWWSDGMDSMDQWMMLCLLCDAVVFKMFFFAIEKSVETCSLYRVSQSIFNGFSMFDSNTSSSRGFTARFMPQDAPGCPRWPDDWMVSWIDHLPFLGPRVRVTRIIQILAADLRMRTERERAGCEAVNFWCLLWPFPFFLPFFCFKNMS